jgi:hypothetical protein
MTNETGRKIVRPAAIKKRSTAGGMAIKKLPVVQTSADAIRSRFSAHKHRILWLRGGGALGAYHRGVRSSP